MTRTREQLSSWSLWGLIAAIGVKLVLWMFGGSVQSVPGVSWLDGLATLVIVWSLGFTMLTLVTGLRRRLLWRVRRKLVLSYVFIGLIPVVLIGVFFTLVALLGVLTGSSYLVSRSVEHVVEEAGLVADAVVREMRDLDSGRLSAGDPAAEPISARYPRFRIERVAPGGASFPTWLAANGFDGLILSGESPDVSMTARAARQLGSDREPDQGVVLVDLPVTPAMWTQIFEDTGTRADEPIVSGQSTRTEGREPSAWYSFTVPWFSFIEHTEWETGERRFFNLETVVSPRVFYDQVFGPQTRLGEVSLGYAFLVVLAGLGVLFLIIEGTALIMGLALARSITGSVHQLFVGTEHVRRGNFAHRIVVETEDQLGELAESFNAMTGSVRNLLSEVAEKKRLEEELRIARRIQMSLLPGDPPSIPGVTVSATCVPAREVGGDYYDFIPLSDNRLGILVADVSGKGTSAAFYMAELKGLLLSLTRLHDSPRDLLVEVNRIIAPHIDSRSFITMIYAVLDLKLGTLTCARAGHTPLIYLRRSERAEGAKQLLPSGLVVGLDGFQSQFEDLLDEQTLTVGVGDIAVLFTDGISEAMNGQDDLFGEDRLSRLIEQHADLGPNGLRHEIVSGVTEFVDGADQHDDMTLVLLKVETCSRDAVAWNHSTPSSERA